MVFVCVCEKCHEHSRDKNLSIEINFSDKVIYFKCTKCGHLNSIELDKKNFKLPKGKVI